MSQSLLPNLVELLRQRWQVPRNRAVLRGASVGLIQKFFTIAASLLVMPLVLHRLGAESFGIWGAITSLGALSGWLDLGVGPVLVTHVARHTAHGEGEHSRELISCALFLGIIVCLLLLVALGVFWLVGGAQGRLQLYWVALAAMALNVPLSTAGSVWAALQKVHVSESWGLVQASLSTCGMLTACLVTKQVWVYVLLFYTAILLANIGSLTHLLLQHKELRPQLRLPSRAALSSILDGGLTFFALTIVGDLSFMLDNVLTLELCGAQAAARMTIITRICLMSIAILGTISQPLWPAFADAFARKEYVWVTRCMLFSMGLLTGLALLGAAILLNWGDWLLGWWLHEQLHFGRFLMWTVCFWIVAQALSRIPTLLLNGLAIIRYQLVTCLIGTAVALALKYYLGVQWHEAGILWGTTLTSAFIVTPANLFRIRRWNKQASAH